MTLAVITASCILQPNIEVTAMITMNFSGTKAYAFESWLMPAYGKQRDLMVVGSEKTAEIDYHKPQELQISASWSRIMTARRLSMWGTKAHTQYPSRMPNHLKKNSALLHHSC